MKKSNGITLVVLVITIVVLLILAGITTYNGIDTVRNSKITVFVTQMRMIQQKVNVASEKGDVSLLGEPISNLNSTKKSKITSTGIDLTNYQYFTADKLEEDLNLFDVNMEVLINFETREIVSVDGIEIGSAIYYTIEQLKGAGFIYDE